MINAESLVKEKATLNAEIKDFEYWKCLIRLNHKPRLRWGTTQKFFFFTLESSTEEQMPGVLTDEFYTFLGERIAKAHQRINEIDTILNLMSRAV